ncbi:MAG: flagellin [Alphaproteobacteria bacterium]|nr:flagellin [Alphaproteobacteria bacterium]
MRVATIGQNEFVASQINSTNFKLRQLEFQITSGLKSQSYSGLSADGGKLLDFESSTARYTSYIESIDQAERRLDVSQSAIAQLEESAIRARSEYFAVQPNYDLDSTVRSTAGVQFESAIDEVSRVLNSFFEGRFLFGNETADQSGLNGGDTQLIDSFSEMITAVDANVGAGAYTSAALQNAVNTYLQLDNATGQINQVAGVDQQAGYYNAQTYDPSFQTTARIDEGRTVDYGIDANELGVRRVVKGLLLMNYAMREYNDPTGFTTTAEARDAFDQGFQDLEQGLEDIRVLVGQTGVRQQTLKQVRAEHETTLALLEQQTAEVRDADAFEATTEFQRLQIQLQASYQVTASLQQLTLSNFI